MNEEICFTLKLESFSVYLICDGETSKKTLKCWSINSLLIFVTNMFSVWRLWQVNPKWVSRSWNQRPSTHRIEAKNDRASFNMKMAQLSIRQIFSPSSEYFYLSRHSPISFSRTLSPRHTQTLYRLLACLLTGSLPPTPPNSCSKFNSCHDFELTYSDFRSWNSPKCGPGELLTPFSKVCQCSKMPRLAQLCKKCLTANLSDIYDRKIPRCPEKGSMT